jgi:ABC-2 type transport system ATP-binding protein
MPLEPGYLYFPRAMLLRLASIGFTYPGAAAPALRNVDLELDTSLITVLVGSNGAGKSTLIRLLTGQLAGYSGSYSLDGEEAEVLRGELMARHRFGYAPDIPILEPHLTGLEMIRMVGSFRGLDAAAVAGELRPFTEAFELGEWLSDKTCDAYSKGMRKKVSLVMGFLGNPAYTFLDEPFDGLDPISIYNFKKLLRSRAERGTGALLSSHMLDAAEKVGDHLIAFKDGSAIHSGSFRALLEEGGTGAKDLEEVYFRLFRT